MRFVFRADATKITGAGHVMRCSVIAEELINGGFEVFFIGDIDEIPWVRDYISTMGFKGIFKTDNQFLADQISDVLILDSYRIPVSDSFIQKKNWEKVLVLFDDATPSYAADIYVHPGPETSWRPPESQDSSLFLFGTKYLLIRKSLRDIKKRMIIRNNNPVRILISAGGSDPFNFAQSVTRILSGLRSDFRAYVLSANFETPFEDPRFHLVSLGQDYENLLVNVDCVLTTAGTSSWEYQFLGIPVAVVSAVENQIPSYRYQIDKKVAWNLGYRDLNGDWCFQEDLLQKLLSENHDSNFSSELVPLSIDGLGVNRVLEFLLSEKS